MKRLLLLLALLLMVQGVSATNIIADDFQDGTNSYNREVYRNPTFGTGCSNYQDPDYAENRVLYQGAYTTCGLGSTSPAASYWAYTNIKPLASVTYVNVYFYNSSWTQIGSFDAPSSSGYRIEYKYIDGNILYYVNGVYSGVAVTSATLGGNIPVYIGLGDGGHSEPYLFDDIIIETNYLDRTVTDMVDSPPYTWTLQLDPSTLAYGLFNAAGTKIRTSPVYVRYVKNDTSSSTITMVNSVGTVVDSKGVSATRGVVSFNPGLLYTNSSPYGPVYFRIDGSVLSQGMMLSIVRSGASVAFNQASYTKGDTATVSYSIEGSYWDTGTYTYKIQTQDVFGNIWATNTITTQTGSVSVDFTDAEQGVYYAILIATPIAGGDAIWMNYDSAEVSAYMKYVGGIYDAESEAQITSNVTVNITQGSITDTIYTETGVYNSTNGLAFGTGSLTTFTVSATGYQTSVTSFTPMIAKTITKNITLIRSSPTCPTGICLGGLANETVYSRPVANVTIAVTNATYEESYSTSTNSVGWYNLGESDGVFFTNGRCYHVTASKTGYTGNTYLKCVVGT